MTIYDLLFLSAASLVAVATRLSAGTTLVTNATLAAVVTRLALMRSFGGRLGTAATTGFTFGTLTAVCFLDTAAFCTLTGVAALAVVAHWATAVLTLAGVAAIELRLPATFCLGTSLCFYTRSGFLAACAGTFLTSAALGVRGTVASSVATATVLAGTLFFLSTSAVGLVAALCCLLAAFVTATAASRAGAAEGFHILLNAGEHHFAYTFGGKGRARDTVDLSFSLAGTFLHDGKGDVAVGSHDGSADELALELLFLDEGTQTGGLALMVEVSTKHFLQVGRNSHISPQATPQATAFQGKHEGISAIGSLGFVNGELLADLLGLYTEGILALDDLTVRSQHTGLLNQFVVLAFDLTLGQTTNVE